MVLNFDLEDKGNILFPMFDYVGLHVKTVKSALHRILTFDIERQGHTLIMVDYVRIQVQISSL